MPQPDNDVLDQKAAETPPQPAKDNLASSSFPSFTALARSFAMPSFSRPRPLSVDDPQPVPSPAAPTPRNDVVSTSKPSPSASGTASPAPREIPFDFQNFLDQMKSRGAEPVSKYLRSYVPPRAILTALPTTRDRRFLSNFAKRTFTVNDQVKIINDFLTFISGQMRACEPWKHASEAEFDNAMEGMEKLVMNRLYDFTFTPQVALAVPPRPITADDLERDRVLSQRIALFRWIEGRHLDILEGEGSAGFLLFAQQELLKINHYKAPRDKLICILNCCKVIYGLIRHLQADESADAFVPILIYVVLKANPEHLLSNVEFINRFRNPEKLQSEAGYYLSSLMGAVSFIETMDHTSLSNISQEEFEHNVEDAIQGLPLSETSSPIVTQTPPAPHAGEESAQPLAMSAPAQSLSGDAKRLLQKTGDTISKPLNAIGRIFTEALDGAETKLAYLPGPFAPFELGREFREQGAAPPRAVYNEDGGRTGSPAPAPAPYQPRVRHAPDEAPPRLGPATQHAPAPAPGLSPRVQALASVSRTATPTPSLDLDLDLAGVERQIDAAHAQAAAAARETLVQIFPGVEVGVVEIVLEAQGGDLGRSIEALLEISVGA